MLVKNDSTAAILAGLSEVTAPEPQTIEATDTVERELRSLHAALAATVESTCEKKALTIQRRVARQNESQLEINSSWLIDSAKVEINYEIAATARSQVFLSDWNGSQAVVKKIKFRFAREDLDKWSYCNEVKFMCRLTEANAPNIIRFYGYYKENASHEPKYIQYDSNILMEFATRGSLSNIIKKTFHQPLEWKIRYEILKGVACGLKHIHLHNIIHRDIKCANIVIDQNWQSKITDFGIAIDKYTKNHEWAGTIQYMAPESLQSAGYCFSEKSDIFGFALVCYELTAYDNIMNMLPENISTSLKHDKIDQAKATMYTFFMSENRLQLPIECPLPLQESITRCWKTNPEERPCADEVEQILEKGFAAFQI